MLTQRVAELARIVAAGVGWAFVTWTVALAIPGRENPADVVSCGELEEVFDEGDFVRDAAAIAALHPKWDGRPILVCVCAGGKTTNCDEIRALFSNAVPTWQVPNLTFVDQLPIGAIG